MIAINAPEDVPEGWLLVPIPEICQLNPPKPAQDALTPDAPVTFAPMPAVDADSGTIATPMIRPFAEVRKGFTAFRDRDVIMAKITPCMENGKAAIARNLENGYGFGSTEFHVFRSSPAILPEFVFYFIRQESFRRAAADEMTGSVGQKRVPAEFLRRAEIPLPPLAEQKRIVAKVETLLARVNAARQRLAKVPALLKRFRQSVLAAACSGQLTEDWREDHHASQTSAVLVAEIGGQRTERKAILERMPANQRPVAPSDFDNLHPSVRGDLDLPDLPAEWCWVDLRFLMTPEEPFCYGVVQPGEDDPAGPRLIRVCDVEAGTVQISNLRGIPSEVHEQYSRSVLRGGELLVTVVGTIGRSAIAPAETAGMNIARAVAKLPIREFDSRFVDFWLGTDLAQGWMVGDAREVARKTLNLEQLRTLPVPLAPLAEQHEIVRRVEALLARADRIEKRLATATRRVETLTQAILAQAFRGELVPTEAELARQEGRGYEPAAVLLERIRDNRPAAKSVKKKRT